MNKRIRQYTGLIAAVAAYYTVHEGAHFLYAWAVGAFKQINFIGLGMQIDVYAEHMTDVHMGIFCLVGSAATLITAYILVFLAERIGKSSSKVFKACMYYITIAMLLVDPLYLSILCGFFGGGDMNGVSLLVPEPAARLAYGILLVLNGILFAKVVLPKYTLAFRDE